ncbi:hypothetical protein BJ684DRAFT_19077 [Piptocephalis cylindrospora]|uniref:Homeobox domain-containing protein n=1 Tax=Piptocephalis cylindrospora TaxID=1907219 RepID=A0A4V1IYH0_9FUNG|nr:hypothetical protein BJ684DRAFT_19077 [Piptocephalis cylindrospora]|eukprot:RKP14529.1 hypothetical protein BJ684DRAFT_19077 [Piptocephalis cylindrospora]
MTIPPKPNPVSSNPLILPVHSSSPQAPPSFHPGTIKPPPGVPFHLRPPAPRPRRSKRRKYTTEQLSILSTAFSQDSSTPSLAHRTLLAHECGISERDVQVWYQNRRARELKCISMRKKAARRKEATREKETTSELETASGTETMNGTEPLNPHEFDQCKEKGGKERIGERHGEKEDARKHHGPIQTSPPKQTNSGRGSGKDSGIDGSSTDSSATSGSRTSNPSTTPSPLSDTSSFMGEKSSTVGGHEGSSQWLDSATVPTTTVVFESPTGMAEKESGYMGDHEDAPKGSSPLSEDMTTESSGNDEGDSRGTNSSMGTSTPSSSSASSSTSTSSSSRASSQMIGEKNRHAPTGRSSRMKSSSLFHGSSHNGREGPSGPSQARDATLPSISTDSIGVSSLPDEGSHPKVTSGPERMSSSFSNPSNGDMAFGSSQEPSSSTTSQLLRGPEGESKKKERRRRRETRRKGKGTSSQAQHHYHHYVHHHHHHYHLHPHATIPLIPGSGSSWKWVSQDGVQLAPDMNSPHPPPTSMAAMSSGDGTSPTDLDRSHPRPQEEAHTPGSPKSPNRTLLWVMRGQEAREDEVEEVGSSAEQEGTSTPDSMAKETDDKEEERDDSSSRW